jgi:homoserine kinase
VHPHTEVLTAKARHLVAEHRFTIGQAVTNLGNVAALVSALFREDFSLFSRCIRDALVEPVRAPLIPGFSAVKQAALNAGALGCSISGSGPSMLAFADSNTSADRIAVAMEAAFADNGLESDRFVGPVNSGGASVLINENR